MSRPAASAASPAPARRGDRRRRKGRPATALFAIAWAAAVFAVVPAAAVLTLSAPAHAAQPVDGCAAPATGVVTATPWPQRRLAPERAWALSRGGSALVAVVDTGVSAAAPALAGAVLPGRDLLPPGNRRADNDCAGRGTFIAGLIAARPGTAGGFAGVAPAARILPVRVSDDPAQVDPDTLAAGIRLAADSGARVIAVSVGTPVPSPELRAAVRHAADRDAVVVAAADLDLGEGRTPYPAGFPGVLAVGGVGQDGRPIASATPGTAPPLAPLLVAPGREVVSIAPTGNGQVVASGAGVGVAFVAGAAALVRDYRPRLTAVEVKHRLEVTADHPTVTLPDPVLGYGVIDPYAALSTVLPEEMAEQALPAAEPGVRLAPVPVTDRRPAGTALAAALALAAAAALGGIAVAVLARGRRRGWRSPWAERRSGPGGGDSPPPTTQRRRPGLTPTGSADIVDESEQKRGGTLIRVPGGRSRRRVPRVPRPASTDA